MYYKAYQIIQSSYINSLEEQVVKFIKQGWQLQGGIAYGDGYFYQAMVKP